MQPIETIYVDEHDIACDGGGTLGHPKIYLHLEEVKGEKDCPYCGCKFIYRASGCKKAVH